MRSYGVRQLAAAFRPASLLAGISAEGTIPRQQAGSSQSGSKLPHSKAQDDSLDGFSRRLQSSALRRVINNIGY
jgi:hypothetical protein